MDFLVDDLGNGSEARITMRATPNYGGMYWAIFCNRVLVSIVRLPESETRRFTIFFPTALGEHAISAAPLGDWDAIPPGVDAAIQQEYFIGDKAKSIQYDFEAVISQRAYGTGRAQFSNWNLTGLRRYQGGRPVERESTQLRMDIVLSNSGSTRTLQLWNEGLLIAEGSRVGNGTIILTERNGSGLGGTVDVTYTAAIAIGNTYFLARWPSAYKVYLNGELTRTVADPGIANTISVQLGPLTAGSHDLQVLAISDTDTTGTLSTADTIIIPGRPEPPGQISLQATAGDWTGTLVQFPESATPGVGYVFYDSALDGPTNLGMPIAIVPDSIAGGIVYWTLPALGSAGTGRRRGIIMADDVGIEDGAMRRITVDYDAGVVVLPLPNVPGFVLKSVSGRTFNVEYVYDTKEQKGVATYAQLFLVADGASPNWASPDAEVALANPDELGFVRGVLSAAAGADGLVKYAVRMRTNGGAQSPNDTLAGPRIADTSVLAAPGGRQISLIG